MGQELGEAAQLRIEPIAAKFEVESLSNIIERFIVAGREIKDSPIAQLPIELAIVDICFGRRAASEMSFAPMATRSAAIAPKARPVAPKAVIESVEEAPSAPVDIESIQGVWNELMVRVRQHNHSLSFVLKSCQLMGIEGATIKLAFKHKFHHDRLNEPAIRQLVEGLLNEVSGKRLVIATILDPNLILVENTSTPETAPSSASVADAAVSAANIDSSVIDNLLKTFGGKVVS